VGSQNCGAPQNILVETDGVGATVSWTAVPGAAGYQLRYRVQGSPTWTPVVINGAATSVVLNGLVAGLPYEYQMRTKCSANPVMWSLYSPLASFDIPLRLGESEGFVAQMFPNPVDDVYNVRVTTDQATDATFTVTGIDGKILSSTTQRVIPGNGAIAFGAEWLPSGMYLLHVTNGDQTHVLRFAVVR
jgi:hypothetical protein